MSLHIRKLLVLLHVYPQWRFRDYFLKLKNDIRKSAKIIKYSIGFQLIGIYHNCPIIIIFQEHLNVTDSENKTDSSARSNTRCFKIYVQQLKLYFLPTKLLLNYTPLDTHEINIFSNQRIIIRWNTYSKHILPTKPDNLVEQ